MCVCVCVLFVVSSKDIVCVCYLSYHLRILCVCYLSYHLRILHCVYVCEFLTSYKDIVLCVSVCMCACVCVRVYKSWSPFNQLALEFLKTLNNLRTQSSICLIYYLRREVCREMWK